MLQENELIQTEKHLNKSQERSCPKLHAQASVAWYWPKVVYDIL